MAISGRKLNDVIYTEIKLNVAESALQHLLKLARNLNSYPLVECVGLKTYAAKALFSREEVGIIKIFFNACHSL